MCLSVTKAALGTWAELSCQAVSKSSKVWARKEKRTASDSFSTVMNTFRHQLSQVTGQRLRSCWRPRLTQLLVPCFLNAWTQDRYMPEWEMTGCNTQLNCMRMTCKNQEPPFNHSDKMHITLTVKLFRVVFFLSESIYSVVIIDSSWCYKALSQCTTWLFLHQRSRW